MVSAPASKNPIEAYCYYLDEWRIYVVVEVITYPVMHGGTFIAMCTISVVVINKHGKL